VGLRVALGLGLGVAEGTGVPEVGVALGEASTLGPGVDVGLGVELGLGVGLGLRVEFALGVEVGLRVGEGRGLEVTADARRLDTPNPAAHRAVSSASEGNWRVSAVRMG